MSRDHRRDLLAAVEREAFDPVPKAKPTGLPNRDGVSLEGLRHRTGAGVEWNRGYGSAEEPVANLDRDLRSAPAKTAYAEPRRLRLPTIEDVRGEVERTTRDLVVTA